MDDYSDYSWIPRSKQWPFRAFSQDAKLIAPGQGDVIIKLVEAKHAARRVFFELLNIREQPFWCQTPAFEATFRRAGADLHTEVSLWDSSFLVTCGRH